MSTKSDQERVDRRAFLRGAGGVAAVIALGTRFASGILDAGAVAQPQGTPGAGAQATPGAGTPAAAAWTPPPIPQPLPTVGGAPPTVVGMAPTASPAPAATPVTRGATPVAPAQVAAQGTPVAGTPTPAVTVTLTSDFRFDPAEVTIKVGQAVRWVNAGRSPQTVTGDPARARDASHVALPSGAKPWDSGVLNSGDEYVHVFDIPGDYVYFSMPQEQAGMVGRVVVQQ